MWGSSFTCLLLQPSTGSTLAEGMLLDAEEAVMANFAFLATEGVMEDDDENLSDEEREDLDETQEIRRPRAKVCPLVHIVPL